MVPIDLKRSYMSKIPWSIDVIADFESPAPGPATSQCKCGKMSDLLAAGRESGKVCGWASLAPRSYCAISA